MYVKTDDGRGFNVDGGSESLLWVVALIEEGRENAIKSILRDQPHEETMKNRGRFSAYDLLLQRIKNELVGNI